MYDVRKNPLNYMRLIAQSFHLARISFLKIFPIAVFYATIFFSYIHYFAPVMHKRAVLQWGLFESVITVCWAFSLIILMKPLLLALCYNMLNKRLSYLELIRKSLDNLDEYIFVVCIYGVCVTLGLMLGIIPGIYFFVAGWFAMPLTALIYSDTVSVFRASMFIVTGNWFRCFGVFMTMILIVIMISLGLNSILLMTKFPDFVYNIITVLLYTVYLVLTASAGVTLLHDLILRQD